MSRLRMPGRLSDRHAVLSKLRKTGLHTVCQEARCPNINQCFAEKTATFLILGDVCTRKCTFCAVTKSKAPEAPDPQEPTQLAQTVCDLGLKHAVITSVTRDDLSDGGATHFAACVNEINKLCSQVTIEVLVPDFQGATDAIDCVLASGPQVFNHNVETVARLYPRVRPQALLERSLRVLEYARVQSSCHIKSGLMVGLGESQNEVEQTLTALSQAGCHVVTIGQYLQPTRHSLPVERIVTDAEFEHYRNFGQALGLRVVAGPLVRSSLHALDVLEQLQDN